jgi:hypothetical protein
METASWTIVQVVLLYFLLGLAALDGNALSSNGRFMAYDTHGYVGILLLHFVRDRPLHVDRSCHWRRCHGQDGAVHLHTRRHGVTLCEYNHSRLVFFQSLDLCIERHVFFRFVATAPVNRNPDRLHVPGMQFGHFQLFQSKAASQTRLRTALLCGSVYNGTQFFERRRSLCRSFRRPRHPTTLFLAHLVQ